jgi:hypothetical protein
VISGRRPPDGYFANPVNLNLKTIKAYFFRLDLDRLWTY